MPIFCQNNVHSLKVHSALIPKFCEKNVNSLKITMLSCPYFLKKTSILSKKLCFTVTFFRFFLKFPLCHAHIWSESILSKLQYSMGQKVKKKSIFFFDFSRKNRYPHTHICHKIVHSLKTPLSCPYFVKKTFILSNTQFFHSIFEIFQ